MKEIRKITIIGAGCVGSFFAKEFYKRGYQIAEVVSHRRKPAEELARQVGAKWRKEDFSNMNTESDLYILSVKDDVILEIRSQIQVGDKIIVHTSGSMTKDVFKKSSTNYGVLYPLQTIIREREIDIASFPFVIEANNDYTAGSLESFARTFTDKVYFLSEDKRVKLHMGAVFASNFTNYLFKISSEILEKENIPFDTLKPLAFETIDKVFEIGPLKAQTGPAKRGDCVIVDKHKKLLTKRTYSRLYSLMSDMIKKDFKKYRESD